MCHYYEKHSITLLSAKNPTSCVCKTVCEAYENVLDQTYRMLMKFCKAAQAEKPNFQLVIVRNESEIPKVAKMCESDIVRYRYLEYEDGTGWIYMISTTHSNLLTSPFFNDYLFGHRTIFAREGFVLRVNVTSDADEVLYDPCGIADEDKTNNSASATDDIIKDNTIEEVEKIDEQEKIIE